MALIRLTKAEVATIASGAAVSGAIDVSRYSGMNIQMPSTWTAASIGFQVCDTEGGTFLPLYDATGTLVQIASPAASKAYSAPAELFAAIYVKLWSQDGAGSDTNQAAARTLTLTFKA